MDRLSEKLRERIDETVNFMSEIDERVFDKAVQKLAYYEDLEAEGRLVILPCKVGEYWRDWNGDRVRIETVSFRKTGRALSSTDMVTYSYVDEEDESAVNWIYFKGHFTREAAEAALKGGAG